MIKEFLARQNIRCIGGFIATYADAITAHTNPGNLHKNYIVIVIKNDETIWATKVLQQDIDHNKVDWIEITRDNINKKSSLLMRKTCFFQIKKGDLFGMYVISEDLISNEHFIDDKSYFDFIIG